MVETVTHPIVRSSELAHATKKPGLSAIIVLKNEQDFAALVLDSTLPFFDELVVVYNGCTDETPQIVHDFERRHPDRVRAFHYVPEVYPRGSTQHQQEPPNSVHSLVNYMNFALSQASYQVVCHWGGDEVPDPTSFGRVIEQLRGLKPGSLEWWLSPWQLGLWWYTGVNLWDHGGQTFVHKQRPIIGTRYDHRLFPAHRWVNFKRYPQSAYLFTRLLRFRYMGCVFFHLKGLKGDRGVGNFQFERNPDSLLKGMVERSWTKPPLETFAEFRARQPNGCDLPDPATLGIHALSTRE